MAIYYTQILSKESRKILTGSFSLAGEPLKASKDLLLHLKKSIATLPLIQKIFSLHSQDKSSLYFYKISTNLIIATIADIRTTDRLISKYFDEIEKAYTFSDFSTPHYEFDDKLKAITDNFNKKYKMLLGVEELENTHTSLVENLDKVINRGENINNLKDLAEKVNFETREMSRRVNRMKLNAKMDEYKIYAIALIAVIFLVIIFLKLK